MVFSLKFNSKNFEVIVMKEREYLTLINKNTLDCWMIIAAVLMLSYIIEIIKGLREVPYVACFFTIIAVPIILSIILYKKYEGAVSLKWVFAIGYSIMYTFVLFTSKTPITFVYILPMVSILIVYSDRYAILGLYGYVILINVICICMQIKGGLDYFSSLQQLGSQITFWEIQVACLFLTGIFLYKSSGLLIKRNNIVSELRNDIYEDALTGLKNVRFLEEYKESLFKLNKNESVSIAFIDIDDFKQFNSNYGHTFGDIVLKEVSSVLMRYTADVPNTYAVRNGGDEFLIISTALTSEDFQMLANGICNRIRQMKLLYQEKEVGVTVSIGVATKKEDGECSHFMDLYNLADERNSLAKKAGKNRVIIKTAP